MTPVDDGVELVEVRAILTGTGSGDGVNARWRVVAVSEMVVATGARGSCEMATSVINGVELYYETVGTGECLVLTHGSWTDGAGWAPAVDLLAETRRVVVWDRRGHSRSAPGDGPGSRAQDANDLAALIEHVSDGPVHVAGNSYGANVTLTLLTERPELVATAAVHEPPLFGLLEGTRDQTLVRQLSVLDTHLGAVRELISAGRRRDGAEYFMEHVALGPGSWDRLPEGFRAVLGPMRSRTWMSWTTTPRCRSTPPPWARRRCRCC
jgi:pimeloyl-ACP methyl ester carboxylesterase